MYQYPLGFWGCLFSVCIFRCCCFVLVFCFGFNLLLLFLLCVGVGVLWSCCCSFWFGFFVFLFCHCCFSFQLYFQIEMVSLSAFCYHKVFFLFFHFYTFCEDVKPITVLRSRTPRRSKLLKEIKGLIYGTSLVQKVS